MLVSKLNLPESAEEISAIAFAVLQHVGISRTDVVANQDVTFDVDKLQAIVDRLNQHEPLQYVFQEAWFYGRRFFVDNRVLIPRPETELLIEWAKQKFLTSEKLDCLDVGTGSGCMAITMALEFPKANVTAIDVSPGALEVAKQNVKQHRVDIALVEKNFLQGFSPENKFDLLISNPPYIAQSERASIPMNVDQFEPRLALYAPTDDALIFYRAMVAQAPNLLKANGWAVVEVNERFAKQVMALFEAGGFYSVAITRDLRHKDRIVSALWKPEC